MYMSRAKASTSSPVWPRLTPSRLFLRTWLPGHKTMCQTMGGSPPTLWKGSMAWHCCTGGKGRTWGIYITCVKQTWPFATRYVETGVSGHRGLASWLEKCTAHMHNPASSGTLLAWVGFAWHRQCKSSTPTQNTERV